MTPLEGDLDGGLGSGTSSTDRLLLAVSAWSMPHCRQYTTLCQPLQQPVVVSNRGVPRWQDTGTDGGKPALQEDKPVFDGEVF